jgi:hypothetical protein
MSRLNEFVREDWAATAEDTFFNDNAVMTLFNLFAGNENLVDSLGFDYLSRWTPDKESFKRCFTPSRLERAPWLPRSNNSMQRDSSSVSRMVDVGSSFFGIFNMQSG